MEIKQVKNVIDELKKHDYLHGDGDYISVTEWGNGEGYDIDLNDKQYIRLSIGELDAINYLTKALQVEKVDNKEKD